MKKRKKSKENGTVALAKKWAALARREEQLAEEKNALAQKLIAQLKRADEPFVYIGTMCVRLNITVQKRPSKGNAVAFFGKRGEDFWDSLRSYSSEYLSLTR